jgi:hypothetical protein
MTVIPAHRVYVHTLLSGDRSSIQCGQELNHTCSMQTAYFFCLQACGKKIHTHGDHIIPSRPVALFHIGFCFIAVNIHT